MRCRLVSRLLNGRQLADQARERRPGLKVLFVTGYAENATLANGVLEPGMAMLTKPFTVGALMRKIGQLVEGGAISSGAGWRLATSFTARADGMILSAVEDLPAQDFRVFGYFRRQMAQQALAA